MKNIFVYGSLREGFFNYDKYLKGKVSKISDARLLNMNLYHMPYKGYPAITEGEDIVMGEIMVINEKDYEETLKAMDEMEGFISEMNPENQYHKVLLQVENIETNQIEDCYVYFYNKDNDERFEKDSVYISDGNWKKHMLNK